MVKFVAISVIFYLTISPAFSEQLKIGLMYFKKDPRFDENFAYARIPLRSKNSPKLALKLAIDDTRMIAAAKKLEVATYVYEVTAENILEKFNNALRNEIKYLILDFPSDTVSEIAQFAKGKDIVLINTTAREDFLRSKCINNL